MQDVLARGLLVIDSSEEGQTRFEMSCRRRQLRRGLGLTSAGVVVVVVVVVVVGVGLGLGLVLVVFSLVLVLVFLLLFKLHHKTTWCEGTTSKILQSSQVNLVCLCVFVSQPTPKV